MLLSAGILAAQTKIAAFAGSGTSRIAYFGDPDTFATRIAPGSARSVNAIYRRSS